MPTFQEAKLRVKTEFFKKPVEIEPEGINDVVFTGTGLRYLITRVKNNDKFSHDKGRVYLANQLGGAWGPAINRSSHFHDEPVIIVVDSTFKDSNFMLTRQGNNNDIVCDQIPKGAILGVYKVGTICSEDFQDEVDPIQFLKERGEEVMLV